MIEDDLKSIEARLFAASRGDWHVEQAGPQSHPEILDGEWAICSVNLSCYSDGDEDRHAGNLALLLSCRSDLSSLLAHVRRLEADNEAMESAFRDCSVIEGTDAHRLAVRLAVEEERERCAAIADGRAGENHKDSDWCGEHEAMVLARLIRGGSVP